jgi:PAS domain-containing protein
VARGDQPARPAGRLTLNYAVDVSAEMQAEQTLRNFIDTLTMTFAHLPIGLAVFDRERRLALFNPALSDLTRLEPDWLAGRPDFYGFLDRLRERHRMPEPKDYRGWRQQLAEMEPKAAQGTYQATWPLAIGRDVPDHRAPASRGRAGVPVRGYHRPNGR